MASSNEAERTKEIAWLKQALKSAPPDSPLAAQMRQRLAELTGEAEPEQESAPREGGHTGGGDFVGRDKIEMVIASRAVNIQGDAQGNIIITGNGNTVTLSPNQAPQVLLTLYQRSLARECAQLPLGTLDPQFIRPDGSGLTLQSVYVNLDVVSPPREKTENEKQWGLRMERGEGADRTPLLEAVASPAGTKLALLGSAGSGKSTFVNYLTLLLLTPAGQQTLPEPLRGLFPIRLVLRKVIRHIAAAEGEAGLWQALSADIAERLGEHAAQSLLPFLQKRASQGRCMVLLDGLDEVPEAGKHRERLIAAIQGWMAQFGPESRFLLTARPYAYAKPAWHLPDFQIVALAPFNEAQVQHFVAHWYPAVAPILGWDDAFARKRADEFLLAVKERAYLADMASRPLLLTLMSTLHSHRGKLPEDRSALYEDSVNLLLQRWQEKQAGKESAAADFQVIRKLNGETLRRIVEELAYETHDRQGQQPRDDEEAARAAADIPFEHILTLFSQRLPEDVNPQALVNYLETRAGLLLGREEGTYAFLHRSFQEYLAASYLANTSANFAKALKERLQKDLTWWREAFLLGVGKARQGGYANAVHVLNYLLPQSITPQSDAQKLRFAILVGQAAVELRLRERAEGDEYLQEALARARQNLLTIVEGGLLTPAERLEAGDTLGKLGDPRFALFPPRPPGEGTGVRVLMPVLLRGRPEPAPLGFVRIPAGAYWLGSPDDDEMAWSDEHPLHQVRLPEFWIARYPVTNAQFRHFVEAGGYDMERYWTPEGWAWRNGKEPSPEQLRFYPKEWQKKMVERARSQPHEPYWWGDPKWGAATRPVVGVTWYEALAYCAWLGEQVSAFSRQASASSEEEERFWEAVASGRYRFTLPSEAEWEAAARGGTRRRYPWGEEITPDHANYDETGLGQTSPVGMFPQGATPETGLLDLSGNVWEWTRSKWGMDVFSPDYGYPYQPEDGRETLRGPELRVVRGGSWGSLRRHARSAFRNWRDPSYFSFNIGFRVVFSLAKWG